MSRRRSRGARAVRSALYGLALAHLLEAVVLRRRRLQLRTLPGPDVEAGSPEAEIVAATGVAVDDATIVAVSHEMETSGAAVVDLVPGDLPVDRFLRFLRRVDVGRLEHDPLYSPAGAHVAVARRPSVAARMAQRPDGAGGPYETPPAPREMVRLTRLAQRYAPGRAVVRVAPELRSGSQPPQHRWDELEEMMVAARLGLNLPPLLVGAETLHLLAMTGGALVAPWAAASALVTWSLQPALVFGGGRRPGLATASLTRLVSAWRDNLRLAALAIGSTRQEVLSRRSAPIRLTPRVEQLFEQRQETCPWCGSDSIGGLFDTPDLSQHRPGTFHLDECLDCRHVFQNPALSPRGMDYYYEGFYDGAGEEASNVGFGFFTGAYQGRMESVARQTQPRAWLDVGTGHGHFCLAARQRWPEARFDGLDIGESVREAQRRGWIDTAYHGLFPDLADGLPRSYDVVSMHHYLEHTTEPRRELAAAAKVLEPGGYVMIEVPDPDCPWARRLGRYWAGWFQPQHLNFVPCPNLVTALDACGFEVVSVQRGTATMSGELGSAVLAVTSMLAPSALLPSQSSRAGGYSLGRAGILTAAAPFAIAGLLADMVKDAWIRRSDTRVGNTYRVVARRR